MSSPTRARCPHCPESLRSFSVPHGLRVHIGRKHKITTPSGPGTSGSSALSTPSNPRDLGGVGLEDLPNLKGRVKVLRHVPTGARCLAAGKLSSLIEQSIESNSVTDWAALMTFAYISLRLPEQGGKLSLTTKVKENIESVHMEVPVEDLPHRPSSMYKTAESKVYEGDLRGAARLLTSDCTFAPSGESTLASLKEKHPTSSSSSSITQPLDASTPCLTVKTDDVSDALHSFYRGSAAGMDGLRPEHLKELTSASAGDNGRKLMESLTRLCNFLLSGKLNSFVCPYMYGGSLCALKKKDGGIRPIAVGNTFRRLVAKLCCRNVKTEMTSYLQPHQVGFGTPLGCEASIHATRAFVMRGGHDVIIKLDIRNAFNSVDRGLMLAEVRELTPSISPFLWQCYSAPSYLSYEGHCVQSQVGAQQGDPLGPLLFSMAIHKVIKSLKSPLNSWYLDDGILGGSPEVVREDVRILFPALRSLGLEVNTAKCEYFPCNHSVADSYSSFASLIPGLRTLTHESFHLLGAPIFPEGLQESLRSKTQILSSLAQHFQHLPAHVSLTLLRSCFALPKITYVIRTAPTWRLPEEVSFFDGALKHILEEILNVHLSETQWLQASLPIRLGGLGVRRLQESGLNGFLASSHGVSALVSRMLHIENDPMCIPHTREAFDAWMSRFLNAEAPSEGKSQRSWDEISGKIIVARILESSSGVDLARLNAASKPESGAWLHALPSPHLGTLLDSDSLRVAAGLRLGCAVCEPHKCICGAMVGAEGHHGLSCTRCAGRRPRHHAINEVIKRALISADIPSALEPPGLSRTDGKRPDGLTLVPWRKGRCLIWDATCVSTYASCHLPSTQRHAGAGAETAARAKHAKYTTLESAYEFVPFAVETAGPWGSEAKKFISELGKRLRERGRDPRSGTFLVQQISLAIQRGNAASLMGTFGRGSGRDVGLL